MTFLEIANDLFFDIDEPAVENLPFGTIHYDMSTVFSIKLHQFLIDIIFLGIE